MIRVSIPAWNLKNANPLGAWDIRRAENPAGSLQAVDGDLTVVAPDNPEAVKVAYFALRWIPTRTDHGRTWCANPAAKPVPGAQTQEHFP